MAIFDALRSFFTLPPSFTPFDPPDRELNAFIWTETGGSERGLSYESIFGSDLPHDHDHALGTSPEEARKNPFVWACQSIISGTIANLPMDALRKQGNVRVPLERQPLWIDEPNPLNPNFTSISYRRQVTLSLLQEGNYFVSVFPDVFDPRQLIVLNPLQVVIKDGDNAPVYAVTSPDGTRELMVLTPLNMLHGPFILPPGYVRGLNPVEAQALSIGIDLASQKQASKFVNGGGLVTGVIEVPAEAGALTEAQKDSLRESFKRKREGPSGYSIGVLEGGAAFKPISQSQQQSDYIASRKLSREEIAGMYLVPPFLIGSQEPGGVAYASAVERAQHFIDYCLIHYTGPIELGHRRLVPGADTYVKINFGALLRGDFKTRTEIYHSLLGDKVVKVDEVREKEDWAPFGEGAGGGFLETPNNNGPKDANTPAEAPRAVDIHLNADTLKVDAPIIPAPIVNVAAPNVTVKPTPVTVQPPDVNVDLGPLDNYSRTIARQTDAIAALADAQRPRPVVKTILKDDDGHITGVLEEPV